mgnify:CR=1 FL=1
MNNLLKNIQIIIGGNHMNENIELLNDIHEDSQMGITSLTVLIKKLNNKDNKIKKIVEEELKGYEQFQKDSEKLLKKYKAEIIDTNMMVKTMSTMKLNFEVMKDNSDAKIADILIKGFTMGTIDMNKKIEAYKDDVKKDILKLAQNFLKFQNENIELLKEYL